MDQPDKSNEPTMILFLSNFGKELLSTSHVWFSDGTFTTAPPPYTQLYVVFGKLVCGKILPAIYGKMWSILHTTLGTNIELQTALMDMEVAVSRSLIVVFGPNINVS